MTEGRFDDEATPGSLADLAAQANAGKTPITVTGDPEDVLAAVRSELIKAPAESRPGQIGNELFRNGVLVRVGRDDDGEPILIWHTKNTLAELLNQRACFYTPDRNGQLRQVDAPMHIIAKVHDAPDVLDVPVVQQIVNAPVFGPNGELRTEPGLLREARVWYEPIDAMKLAWPVPEMPGPEHVGIAKSYIDYLLCDFPFVGDADRAHAWAMLIQPFVRPMITGSTPLYVVEAPTAGTGKGLLVTVLLLPALGYEVAAQQEVHDPDEWRKKIVAFLLKGKSVFFLDNVKDRLDSGVLSSALTQPMIEDRILGLSRMASAPTRCLWAMTANNPRLSQEVARRGVQIRIDRKMARPQTYTNLREPDLIGWTREHRGQLAWSVLTIVQAWLAAGQPGPTAGTPDFGSFTDWRRVMGGILSVVGLGDAFLGNAEEFWREHTDDESDETCAALEHWWVAFGETPVTASDLAHRHVPGPGGMDLPVSIADMLLGADGEDLRPRGKAVKLGVRLRGLERRVLCDYRVERVGTRQRASVYALSRTE